MIEQAQPIDREYPKVTPILIEIDATIETENTVTNLTVIGQFYERELYDYEAVEVDGFPASIGRNALKCLFHSDESMCIEDDLMAEFEKRYPKFPQP